MFYPIFFLILALILFFWQISQIISVLAGVPAVYSRAEGIEKAFKLAKLESGQIVVDLGCGNGKALILAAKKFSARGIGVEISPFYYLLARIRVFLAGESKNIQIVFGDFRKKTGEVKKADLIYLYSFPETINEIESWLFDSTKPGTKIISVGFPFKNHKSFKTATHPALFLYQNQNFDK